MLQTEQGSGCAKWLGDGIGAIIDSMFPDKDNRAGIGYGYFSDNDTWAIKGGNLPDGTSVDTPYAITINANGGLFRPHDAITNTDNWYDVGGKSYRGGAGSAQAAILLHELAHVMSAADAGASGFLPDFGNQDAHDSNSDLLGEQCRDVINAF